MCGSLVQEESGEVAGNLICFDLLSRTLKEQKAAKDGEKVRLGEMSRCPLGFELI